MLKHLPRLLHLPEERSYFLFGARNTGKSTLLEEVYSRQTSLFIDLLDSDEQVRFNQNPNELYQIVMALPESIKYVIIDEIQKIPRLLDVVQRLMKFKKWQFIMTGSSARKLKRGGANLLAGRAFVYYLFPFTAAELGSHFNLEQVLRWGSLPDILSCETDEEKHAFLQAYAHTYLKEEIWEEQFIKTLSPFRKFLEVAAQANGKIINFSNIARDVGVDDKTIKSYYLLLEDTLIGFFLDPFQHSFRKRLQAKPKFYFFDVGIARGLNHLSLVPLQPGTSHYGESFEHFIILECIRLATYYQKDYRFSYLQTKNDLEIDLVVERPGKPLLLIEIKSAKQITEESLSPFIRLTMPLIAEGEAICLCQEKYPKQLQHVLVLPWQDGLKIYFEKEE